MLLINKGNLILKSDRIDNIVKKYIDLVPEEYRLKQQKRDANTYHITILYNYNNENYDNIDENIYPLGLVLKNDVYYILVHYPSADKLYKNNIKHFHITIGFKNTDNHTIEKDMKNIIKCDENVLDNILVHTINIKKRILYIEQLINTNHHDSKCLYYISKLYIMQNDVNKSLCYANQLYNDDLMAYYYLKLTINEYLKINSIDIIREIDKANLKTSIMMSDKDLKLFIDRVNTNGEKYFSIENNILMSYKLPMNFSKVFDCIYASGEPAKYRDTLNRMNITEILTLTETKNEITTHHVPIIDRESPTIEEMISTIEYMNEKITEGKNVLVHCLGGVGRTNTILTCYYIYQMMKLQQIKSTDEAINYIKNKRPKMILSQNQINFIKNFNDYLINGKIITKVQNKLTKLVLMCGYPSSGKSTISQTIADHVLNVVRLNQDELGKKKLYEEIANNIKNKKTVIIDKCNLSIKERKELYEMFNKPSTTVIYMDMSIEICKERIKHRVGHKIENNGEKILDCLKNNLESPINAYETYDIIERITNNEDIINFYNKLGIELSKTELNNYEETPYIIKFCRTHHLLNLGSATRDDLIMNNKEQSEFLNRDIYIEEKIDGANIGFSLKDGKIVAQNRSHYVNSATQSQFKELDKWIMKHTEELYEILDNGKYILFGEWLYAKHSINYTNLPDYFIAFDLYDISKKKFMSREKLEEKLQNSSINIIRLINKTSITNINDIKKYIVNSIYYNGLVEGIYVRFCEGDYVVKRGKVVRTDFLTDDKHWSKNTMIKNTVVI